MFHTDHASHGAGYGFVRALVAVPVDIGAAVGFHYRRSG
jgi:hypothetical protein